jgi:hypothetical protein
MNSNKDQCPSWEADSRSGSKKFPVFKKSFLPSSQGSPLDTNHTNSGYIHIACFFKTHFHVALSSVPRSPTNYVILIVHQREFESR